MEFGGLIFVFAGAVVTAVAAFSGSLIGMFRAGQAAAGIVLEKPNLFGKMLLMQALPGSQGIYGLVGAFLILNFAGIIGGDGAPVISLTTGIQYFIAGLPIAITGFSSAIYQGTIAATASQLIVKDEANTGRAIVIAVMVETWAIFGLLISFILLTSITQ